MITLEYNRYKLIQKLTNKIHSLFGKKVHIKSIIDLITRLIFYISFIYDQENTPEDKFRILYYNNKYEEAFNEIIYNKIKYSYISKYYVKKKDIKNFQFKIINLFKKYSLKEKKFKKKLTYEKNITKVKYKSYYILSDNYTKFKISKTIYDKLSETCIMKKNKDKYIFWLYLRYEKILKSGNNQLIIHDKYLITKKYDVELFASPINRRTKYYCSAFADTDKYFIGRLGSFMTFNPQCQYMNYICNPPFINIIIKKMINKLYLIYNNNKKNIIYVTIPAWDNNAFTIAYNKKNNIKKNIILENIFNTGMVSSVSLYKNYKFIEIVSNTIISPCLIYEIIIKHNNNNNTI